MSGNRSSGRKRRVLHILQNLNYGGMERLLFEMLRISDADRFENHVLNLQYIGRFGEGLEEYASVSVAPPMSRFSMLRPAALAGAIREIAPDVVHTHSGVWYKASRAARMAGVPRLVHTEHGRAVPDPWLSRFLDGRASRRTDAIVAVSETVAGLLKERVVHHPDRVRVIPNGVDVSAFPPREPDPGIRRELGVSDDAPVIGSIGRLERVKGYEVMVDAFAALDRMESPGPRPMLIIAGHGAQRDALAARAEAAGIADRVRWLGWRDDVLPLYSAFDLFTMSSHSEGTSISLLEAMSAGLCPVVTDVGGNRAVLGKALRHRLVPPADPAALARAWREALDDPAARSRDGQAARRRVTEAYSLETMVRRYEDLYRGEESRVGESR